MQKLSFSLIHESCYNQSDLQCQNTNASHSIMSCFERIVAIHLDFQLYHIHPTEITLNHTFKLFIPL